MPTTKTLKPEWGNAEQAFEQFGFKKGTLYRLADTGQIRSALVRIEGNKKGVRLFDLNSIRELLASNIS
jgi:hypothetical protein